MGHACRKFALHRTKANGGYVDTTLPEWQASLVGKALAF